MNKSAGVISLGFDRLPWSFAKQGKYLLVEDPRGLHQIFHPWDTSESGDFATVSADFVLPSDWNGSVYLNFYASDTYVAEGWEEVKPTWTHAYASCHNLVGHRFKQVLIQNNLVWEQDVADPESFGYTSIDITKYLKPGKKFKISLRVIDKVSPSTKLPKDEFHLGIWSWQGLGDKDADKKFYTRVFWGDVALSLANPLDWSENPARKPIPLNPVKQAVSQAAVNEQGTFTLSAPNGLPTEGYPVTWGMPFAQGKISDTSNVRILDPSGVQIPLQTQVLHRHSDGSIHWLLLDFQARADDIEKQFTVNYGSQVKSSPATPGLVVTQSDGKVSIDTGGISFSINKGAAALAESVTIKGDTSPIGKQIVAALRNRDGWLETEFVPVNDKITLEAQGPERASVCITGNLVSGEKVFGRFTCRIHAYRGKPYLRVLFRIFNDTDAPAQLVTSIELKAITPLETARAVIAGQSLTTGPAETQRLLVRQNKCDMYEIFEGNDTRRATGTQFVGPVTLQDGERGVSGEVLHFAPLYPKRTWAGSGGRLVFDLFTPTVEYEQYVMTRGEAKRHEVLLYFHKGNADQPDIQAAFKAFEASPMLLSAQWYAENQAFGRGAPLSAEKFPELHKWMVEGRAPSLQCYQPFGLRNWPDSYSDSIYSAYRGTWGNLYQELDYGSYIVGLLAGERAWIDYAFAYQQHFMDLDICHYNSDKAWVGAPYGISPYHTGHEPYPLNAPLGGLFILHYLTGDMDAWESAVGIAEWVNATNQGLGAGSGRAVGWPLRSSMIAYENTSDAKHLETGKRLAEYALGAAESRRGFFSESPATWHYRGGTPTMNSILMAGLMHYWRVSGDDRIGKLCSNISHNMAYSWMSPIEPGLIYGSDPLQQVNVTGYAMQDIMPIFWGYELTGSEVFLKKGVQMMQASILDEKHNGSAFGLSRYWEMQDILYYYSIGKKGDGALK